MGFFSFIKKKPASQKTAGIPQIPVQQTAGAIPTIKPDFSVQPDHSDGIETTISPRTTTFEQSDFDIPLPPKDFAPEQDQVEFEENFISESSSVKHPLFVDTKQYIVVLESIKLSKKQARITYEFAYRINELAVRREKACKDWQNNLELIQRNLMIMDKILFKT